MNAICLITYKPNMIWCDFLNNFNKYKIFIIVDDNNFDLTYFINHYKNITFVKVLEDKCKMFGYIDCNFCLKKLISGWDKALYYFAVEDINFNFIWFIEDDVFFYNENTIFQIDNKYLNDDLLSNKYGENTNGEKNTWHWRRINIEYAPPYYSGMMCVVRFSQNMFRCINEYANQNKTLFFLEALFPTIAIKNSLKYTTPDEFSCIYYRYDFKTKEINRKDLYHPIKDVNMHVTLRKEFEKSGNLSLLLTEILQDTPVRKIKEKNKKKDIKLSNKEITKIYLNLIKNEKDKKKKKVNMVIR